MLSFAQYLDEMNMGDRYHGIITHDGKTHDQHHGYNPGAHHDMARKHGYDNAKHLTAKGGVRFAQYEGGIGKAGHRIEYEYQHPSAHKHIIKHIKSHPTSGGYALVRNDGDKSDFTEHDSAAKMIAHLKSKKD